MTYTDHCTLSDEFVEQIIAQGVLVLPWFTVNRKIKPQKTDTFPAPATAGIKVAAEPVSNSS